MLKIAEERARLYRLVSGRLSVDRCDAAAQGGTMMLAMNRRNALILGVAATASACASARGAGFANTSEDAAFSDAALREILGRLDEGPGLAAGGPGELAIAAHLEERFAAFGYGIEKQEVMAPAFDARETAVHLGAATINVVAQAIPTLTGPQGVTAPLRLWRDASDTTAVANAIAVIPLPHARHSRLGSSLIMPRLNAAIAGGARAAVLVTFGPSGETIILNADFNRPAAQIPVAVIGPREGAPLLVAAEKGEEARLVIDGRVYRRPTPNLIGRIAGRGPMLVVSTPRTGWLKCVAERGPGVASFLALAEWAAAALPRNDLFFVATTAHEYDNGGSLAFINGPAPKPEDVALWVHLGAGFASRDYHEAADGSLRPLPGVDSQRYLMGSDETTAVLARLFAGQPGLERAYPSSGGAAGELMEILNHGYAPAFGMFAGNRYHHTTLDRADNVHPAAMRSAAIATRDAIREMLLRS
jgi:hypothetical protein